MKEECDECNKDLNEKIQVYPKEGGILCEECNWKKKDED